MVVPLDQFAKRVDGLSRSSLRILTEHQINGSNFFTAEFSPNHPDRSGFRILERARLVTSADGRVTKALGVVQDISEFHRTTQTLRHQAHNDALTGLTNRSQLEDHLGSALRLAQRTGSKLSLLFIDLDGFKGINDTIGHDIGDALLREVSKRLRNAIRASDLVARWGGDEFAVVVQGMMHEADAGLVALSIAEQISTPFMIENHEFTISASVGVAIYPRDGKDSQKLLRHADMAMYQAKRSGGGTISFYDQETQQDMAERHALHRDLRKALDSEELCLSYQPVFSIADDSISSVEGLIRWNHPVHRILTPEVFMEVARNTRLIEPLGRWVIEEACRQSKSWRDQGIDLPISINISSNQIQNGIPVDWLERMIETYDVQPWMLTFEIKENLIAYDTELARKWIAQVQKQHIRVTLDEYGALYASVRYLQKFHIEQVKLAMELVQGASHDSDSYHMVKAIAQVAQTMNIEMTAKGIEDAATLKLAKDFGCRYAQGFHFSQPLSEEEVTVLAKQQHNKPINSCNCATPASALHA
jgi:diguanylate cyclase (GGDEF)-like protein